jgi:hypothetical protein
MGRPITQVVIYYGIEKDVTLRVVYLFYTDACQNTCIWQAWSDSRRKTPSLRISVTLFIRLFFSSLLPLFSLLLLHILCASLILVGGGPTRRWKDSEVGSRGAAPSAAATRTYKAYCAGTGPVAACPRLPGPAKDPSPTDRGASPRAVQELPRAGGPAAASDPREPSHRMQRAAASSSREAICAAAPAHLADAGMAASGRRRLGSRAAWASEQPSGASTQLPAARKDSRLEGKAREEVLFV